MAAAIADARVPVIEAAKTAIALRTIQGSPKFAELLLELCGLRDYDLQPSETPTNSNNGVQVGSVTFVNVPIPPTPQQAEALRPPPGSNSITPAPALPAMPVRAARKDCSRG